ncbi:MAG: hypothetical protein JNL32_11675 [Candidatus Kapabacteria bacterium]|nr:hypothetical protein [Candidatus Kapabacteria bacterium]
MNTTNSRRQYIELRKHSLPQTLIFFGILIVSSLLFFRYAGIDAAHWLLTSSLKAKVEREGEGLNYYTTWRMEIVPEQPAGKKTESSEEQAKEYSFDPLLSILPVMAAFGMAVATVVTGILPQRYGFVRQKIEREIINVLHRYARIEYGDHTDSELLEISDRISTADLREMHDLEEQWSVSFYDLSSLQSAIQWRERSLPGRLLRIGDAMGFYLRSHFTQHYENPVLGLIYIGAAILIIIIGLRGLQFIPKDKPSLVLFAISLEFILLIVYAITLIYTKQSPEEHQEPEANLGTILGGATTAASTNNAEKMLRMFIALPRHQGEQHPKDQQQNG